MKIFRKKNRNGIIVCVILFLLVIMDVFLFTYVSTINRYKYLSKIVLKDNSIVRNMDLDISKYDDVLYTALKGEGVDKSIDDEKESKNHDSKNLDERKLNYVRENIITYSKRELLNKILEENEKKSFNIHIKVTSYMYHKNAIARFVKKICVNQLHIEDKLDNYLRNIYGNVKYFPIVYLNSNKGSYSYDNSWGSFRNYGGNRKHEGIDIMYSEKKADVVPIVSVSDGIIIKKGWLELGGNRLLIKTGDNINFYYAHLASYAQGLEEGMKVKAGQLIGYMGNSGYGPEGTKGKFDVHLHFGMYYKENNTEISVNPYYLLKFLAINKLYYK